MTLVCRSALPFADRQNPAAPSPNFRPAAAARRRHEGDRSVDIDPELARSEQAWKS